MIFGTVIHAEHAAKAIMMAKSIKKHIPNGKVIIGVMEETMPNAAVGCPCFDEVVLMKDMDAYSNMKKFFFQYTLQEAQRACKALLVNYIYKKYTNDITIHYLDADTWVISPFEELADGFNQHPITLIGKVIDPEFLDLDWLTDVRKNGIYDSSFMSFKRHSVTESFLKCWLKLSENNCYYDQAIHNFIDQGWLDQSHTLFDGVFSLRDAGYQVSHSNLMERWDISKTAPQTYSIGNKPLRSIRISNNFELAISWIEHEKGQLYGELIEKYKNEWIEVERNTAASSTWSYSHFTSGEVIADQTRGKFRMHYYDNSEVENPFLLSNGYFHSEAFSTDEMDQPIPFYADEPDRIKHRNMMVKKRRARRKLRKSIRKKRRRSY
ncbi:hypothetical protein AB4Z45_10755 [Paenibacillus sp. MCAF9]|uniref:hypothetical protein n=1 Tax=Paenibacillus sp. MCAF9 TaxID=3233046 RepID=UPI003F976088